MKRTKFIVVTLLVLFSLVSLAWLPDSRNFNPLQFDTNNFKISIKPSVAISVNPLVIESPGLGTNYLYFTNVVVQQIGEDTNTIIVSGAGTANANGTYRLKNANVPSAGFIVYTNDNGITGIIRDPDLDYIDNWALTNYGPGLGTQIYDGDDAGPQSANGGTPTLWTHVNSGLAPNALVMWGYSTNSFTNFVSDKVIIEPPNTRNIWYVRTNGDNHLAQAGNEKLPWKNVWDAYTNLCVTGIKYSVLDIGPGVFDETARFTVNAAPSYTSLPLGTTIKGAGRGTTKLIANQGSAIFHCGDSNRVMHLTVKEFQFYTAGLFQGNCTNFIMYDVEADSNGDVWVSDQTAYITWEPYFIDCDFKGASDKWAVLTFVNQPNPVGGLVNQQTNSRIFLIDSMIGGGTGADGDGLNRGGTTPDGVRLGNYVMLNFHNFVTGFTNTAFKQLLADSVILSTNKPNNSGVGRVGINITNLAGAITLGGFVGLIPDRVSTVWWYCYNSSGADRIVTDPVNCLSFDGSRNFTVVNGTKSLAEYRVLPGVFTNRARVDPVK